VTSAVSLELLLASALVASSLAAAALLLRSRRLAERLRSLTRPAHELRGALTALQLGLDLADRPRCADGVRARTEGLRAQLERANLALADLDCRRHGAVPARGDVRWKARSAERLDLTTLVLRSARAWAQLAPGYGAVLDVDWRAGPLLIDGRATALEQALDNLIANALEHGGGHVLVEGERRGDRARVTISDGGPGPEQVCSGSNVATWRSPRGHGLAIAEEAIAAHGGRLMTGVGGNGAAVVIELPVSTTAAASPSPSRQARRAVGAGSRAA
jgi:two-component system sensor histidine kinase MtrB